MATKRSNGKKKGITLRDVISHIQGVKSELSTEMKHLEQRLIKRIDGSEASLRTRIDEVESNMIERHEGLDRDIRAVMGDTVTIRRHVGMAVPDEE